MHGTSGDIAALNDRFKTVAAPAKKKAAPKKRSAKK